MPYFESRLQKEPPQELRARVEAAMGKAWVTQANPAGGLSSALRFIVGFADGGHAFVKAATTEYGAGITRKERLALSTLPADLVPRTLAWIEEGGPHPILVMEALLDGHWPAGPDAVTWRPGDLPRVLDAIRRVNAQPADALPPVTYATSHGWRRILEHSEPFLGRGLCSRTWLAAHGEMLAAAEESIVHTGNAFVHGDMRSDNIWIGEHGVKFVDFQQAVRGAPETDVARLLPVAHLEGCPAPYEIFPEGGGWAAHHAANHALRAIEETDPPDWLRRIFWQIATVSLDWAARSLRLVERDGPDWQQI